jgi:uncharacterized membrane protein
MRLSDTGESRVRGYLFMLERSLRATGPAHLAADAVREVESHIRERVAESDGMPNERDALERILQRLGAPATVARAYSLEMSMDDAAVGGRFVAVMRSLFLLSMAGVGRFLTAYLLFAGYAVSISFVATALLKPIFPRNVGIWVHEGFSIGVQVPAPDAAPLGGYWIIPIFLVIGLTLLVVVHRTARRWIARLREARMVNVGDAETREG